MRTELVVRFDYGHVVPWVRRREGRWTAVAGPDGLWLDTPVDAAHALRDTERFWRDWIGQCSYDGGYRAAVHRSLFERLLGLRNDVGPLSEEWDPAARRQLGNTPQAFSHVALVNSALALHRGCEHLTRNATS
jgi:GH15 family glucan-1,4-alpha-glucosidase